MNILSLENISKNYGDKLLFERVTLGLEAGERIGLIGVNGSGKTTLLRIIAGLEPPDEGRVAHGRDLRIGYLSQNPQLDDRLTVLDQALGGVGETVQLLREYEAVTAALAQNPDDETLLDQLAELSLQMDVAGAWEIERRVRAVLNRLGIGDTSSLVGTLSGGQRRRLALAGALLNPSDLLILDEPTNHLDTEMVAWLEEELGRFSGALLLVTHDRYFLERIVQRMIELDRGRVWSYSGSYARYLEQRTERQMLEAAAETARQNLLRKELAWLRRGARGRTTKQKAHVERVEQLMNGSGLARSDDLQISVASRRIGKRVLELRHVSKSYDGRPLLRDLSYTLEPGERLGIIGPNGSGKTTLLNLLAERVRPDSGEIERGATVHMAYYDQESAGLDESQRVIDYLREAAELSLAGDGALLTASQMLERFLFPSAAQWAYISTLSGGERRRLYLLRTLVSAPNVLLLDEPTNDLDIQTLTVLEDYLDTFVGTLVTVSHDRYFLDRCVERLLVLDGSGGVRGYPGGYSLYRELLERDADPQGSSQPLPAKERPAQAREQSASVKRKPSYKERRELAELEELVATLEEVKVALEQELNAPGLSYSAYQGLADKLATTTAELEAAFERWTELAERVEN